MAVMGHVEPRIFTPPLRELTPETSAGYSVIAFAERVLGVELMDWQKWLLVHALELSPRGGFRFRTVLALVARQNGKSFLLMLVALWSIYILQVALVLGTAQNLSIAEALWEKAADIVEQNATLAPTIKKIHRQNGGKRLIVMSGGVQSEYRVASASRQGGRGLTGDLIILDELREHKTFDAWSAITKTTLTRQDGQVWCISNAGDGSSVVLSHLRDMGHRLCGDPDGRLDDVDMFDDEEREATSLGIFEWSAPPDADPADPETWAWANPSLGRLITEETLREQQVTDPPEVFLTECLCQWVTSLAAHPFPGDSWEASADADSFITPTSPISFGVDVSDDRRHASIVACGQRPDGDYHVELVAYVGRASHVEQWFRRRIDGYGGRMVVGLQGRGCPAAALVSSLKAIPGLEVASCCGPDLTTTCGAFFDAIACQDTTGDGQMGDDDVRCFHLSQPGLDIAAEVAERRNLGDGAWAWDRRKSPEDISPLVAATMAFGLASGVYQAADDDAPRHPSSYKTPGRSRGVLVV